MNGGRLIEKIIDFIFSKIPCFLGGHIYIRPIKSGEPIYLNNNGPKVEYTCEKCGKKRMLIQ